MTGVPLEISERLDRLSWSSFHWRVALALGITWVLDGVEVTLAGSLAGALQRSPQLQFTANDVGLSASAYLVGAVVGAVFFGYLADRQGRKRLYVVTLLVYLVGTLASACAWSFASYAAFRAVTGAGIGGEYAAINSAVQEFTPARLRGRVDLYINGSFWAGAMLGAAFSDFALAPYRFPPDIGWRLAYGVGAIVGGGIILLRRYVPESPRWLITHQRRREAEQIVRMIEAEAGAVSGPVTAEEQFAAPHHGEDRTSLAHVLHAILNVYRMRAILALVLMAAQAFCYNAIFFTYALTLTTFYRVPIDEVGSYVFFFAAANLLGPLVLGRLFDTIGRRPMIAATYLIAGLALAGTGLLFRAGALSATSHVALWSLTFFVASAAASAAYLTIGESFPLETRAMAIALFYAIGTLLGGVAGPATFGALISEGSRSGVPWDMP
jgi:MFS family permease